MLLLAPNILSHFELMLSCQQRQIVVELETVNQGRGIADGQDLFPACLH